MVDYRTYGSYNGPAPEDPNAEIRKLFTVPANQQDGLASILQYVQKKVGFTVGSTSTKAFQQVMRDEFSDILLYQPAGYESTETKTPIPADQADQTSGTDGNGSAAEFQNSLVKSIIEFINKMDSRDLTLDIKEEHTIRVNGFETVVKDRNAWEVHRSRMAEKADWLVDHIGLKDSMDEWCKRITGRAP